MGKLTGRGNKDREFREIIDHSYDSDEILNLNIDLRDLEEFYDYVRNKIQTSWIGPGHLEHLYNTFPILAMDMISMAVDVVWDLSEIVTHLEGTTEDVWDL